jgi:hypothetical protein
MLKRIYTNIKTCRSAVDGGGMESLISLEMVKEIEALCSPMGSATARYTSSTSPVIPYD